MTVATTAARGTRTGASTLSVTDPSATAPGRLVNGAFALPQAVQARVAPAGTFGSLGSAPLNLLSYSAPVSNDALTLEFKQPIAATDPLRTGTYAKTVVFTLWTTTP